jgi:hypothetical protein
MPIRSLVGVLVFAVLLVPPCLADDPVELSVKRDARTRWKVEQTLELASKNKGATTFAGGMGQAQAMVKGHVTVKEKWTDEGAKEESGRLVELKRTVSSSKLKAKKGPNKATAIHKTTLVFEIGEDGHEVRATKGKAPDLCLDLLKAGPIDPVELLLPSEPVQVGQEWEIGAEEVMKFQRQICVGVAAAQGPARDDIALLLQSLAGSSPASAAKIVKGKLVSVKGSIATVAFEDDKTHDELTKTPQKGPLFDIPVMTTTIEGTLTFDMKKGRPVKLAWKQVHDSGDFKPGPNVPGGNISVPGFTETWTLSKSWK